MVVIIKKITFLLFFFFFIPNNAYASVFFKKNYYISDGQHYFWKNYSDGILIDDALDPVQAISKGIPGIYILTHPMNWFESEYHLMF